MWNLVAQDLLIHSGQNKPFELRLRHQQSIEWVAMQLRKPTSPLSLFNGDWHGKKSMPLNRFSNGLPEDQLP
jgi:hypothetical protein